ncbi:class I SAM-dependent methyltransferase family protein [Candidatus Bathyarchaeota archaeon]|nr:class I SAM-dependent methyltransferase family protein [Candidatus Bathyarchaeota archaeon]
MPKKSVCIKIPKINGEKAITLANKTKLLNKELEIKRNETFLYIPLIHSPSQNELTTLKEQIPDFTILTSNFSEKRHTKTFVELLENKLPPHLLASLPRALDFVGDIAIVEVPPELDTYKDVIGNAILKTHKSIRTVLAKAGAVSGPYRLREFHVVAGEPKTKTIHKEYGCQYYVDLAKAYFSPRLSYEHNRLASLVRNGEIILDLFAGVGPFAILIAKTRSNAKVYAVDANPDAINFLKKNIRLNKVGNKVYPILGDARHVVDKKLFGVVDRVIMNLPEKALEFVDAACKALKPTGGIVHFYSFVSASNSFENMKQKFDDTVEKSGRKVEQILFSKLVRATAPYEWQAVLDAKIL